MERFPVRFIADFKGSGRFAVNCRKPSGANAMRGELLQHGEWGLAQTRAS
jgi:hypothetical protein